MTTEIRLAYESASRIADRPGEIGRIEAASLSKNARIGVTGGLYYDGEMFFQVLEGPEAAVALLYDRIRKDPRHGEVALVCRHVIQERMFGLWTMKLVSGLDRPQMRATFRAAAAVNTASGRAWDPRITTLQQA